MLEARVQSEPFDLAAEHARLSALSPGIGAIVSFIGQVRDTPLLLEHWPGVAQRRIADLIESAARRWPLHGVIVVHRYGTLSVGQPIVMVLTASVHRQPAFEAAAYLMDWLKTEAPFWKKEEGGLWVEPRASDSQAAQRWVNPPSG